MWSYVSKHCSEVKHYLNRLDSLEIKEGVLYKKFESEKGVNFQVISNTGESESFYFVTFT